MTELHPESPGLKVDSPLRPLYLARTEKKQGGRSPPQISPRGVSRLLLNPQEDKFPHPLAGRATPKKKRIIIGARRTVEDNNILPQALPPQSNQLSKLGCKKNSPMIIRPFSRKEKSTQNIFGKCAKPLMFDSSRKASMASPLKKRHISSFLQPTLDFDSKVSTDGSNKRKSETSQHGTDGDSDIDVLSNIDLPETETGMIAGLDQDCSELSSLYLSDEDSGLVNEDLVPNPRKST